MPWKFSRPLIEQHTSCLPYCLLLVSFAVSILELPKKHNCTDFSRGKQRKVLLKASYLSMTTARDYKISMSTVNWINHFDHLMLIFVVCLVTCPMSRQDSNSDTTTFSSLDMLIAISSFIAAEHDGLLKSLPHVTKPIPLTRIPVGSSLLLIVHKVCECWHSENNCTLVLSTSLSCSTS